MTDQYSRNVVVVKVSELIKKVPGKCMDKVIKSFLVNPATIHILDFSDVLSLTDEQKLSLLSYGQLLRRHSKFLYSIQVDQALKENIKRKETIEFLEIKATLAEVPGVQIRKIKSIRDASEAGNGNFVLSANYLQVFTEKAKYVLETQMKVPVQILKPYIKGMHFDRIDVGVTSMIEVKSAYLTGWLAYTFSENVYLKVCRAITGEDHTQFTVESLDTIGELLNITYGCIKQDINKKETIIEMSLPTKVHPDQMSVYHDNMDKAVVVPFQTKYGFIGFEIVIEKAA